jgi:hypothetical protein
MKNIKTSARLRDRFGQVIRLSYVHPRMRVSGLLTLAQWINYQAFGRVAYSRETAPRIPVWDNVPTPSKQLSEGDRAREIGRWALGHRPLRLLLDLESYLKQCRQCRYWFVDLTRSRSKKQCSERCANRWWTRSRRREGSERRTRPALRGGRRRLSANRKRVAQQNERRVGY